MYSVVDVLVNAAQRWENLFDEDFEVQAIPSSEPAQQPLDRKGRTASEIIGRMTSDETTMAIYREHAEAIEACDLGLESELFLECTRKSFRPIVHSEVLLADWIQRNGGTQSTRFFGGWSFIGCSKPTCRLCHYYFQCWSGVLGHGDVQVRASHRTVYNSWRVPDVMVDQGLQAPREREKVMNGVLERVRNDVFRILQERAPGQSKRYDSNTSSRLPAGLPPAIDGTFDLLTSRIGALALVEARRRPISAVASSAIAEVESEDEDNAGGASLG